MCSCVAPLAPKRYFGGVLCYMSLCTTIVACSVRMVFPCLPVVLVVVVIVSSILVVVRTLILVLSVVCILASVWNVVIQVQLVAVVSSVGPWFAISMSLALICLSVLGMGIFKSNRVPVTLAILAIGCQCRCYERVHVSILSCVDYE